MGLPDSAAALPGVLWAMRAGPLFAAQFGVKTDYATEDSLDQELAERSVHSSCTRCISAMDACLCTPGG